MAGLVSGSKAPGFRRIVVLLIALVTVPTALLLAMGIIMLVFYEAQLNILFGILLVALVLCLGTGSVLALVLLKREADLSRLQSDFVSKVSHELRTPLTAIGMFVETLESKRVTSPEEVDTCLAALHRETQRLTDRIERLLDWGRMEAGKRVYRQAPERVADIVDEAIKNFRTGTLGQEVHVAVDVPEAMPTLHADKAAIVDALVNLLSNAHKYSTDNTAIGVRARHRGEQLQLSVWDHGVGIPRREQRRIFEKFYRVREWLAQDVQGSGLGLAIVRHIALGHGGRVIVDSEPNQGSTFTLVLPLTTSAAQEATDPAPAATEGGP